MTAPVPPEAVVAAVRAARSHHPEVTMLAEDAFEWHCLVCGAESAERLRSFDVADQAAIEHSAIHVAPAVVAALHLPERDRETAAKALDDAADADDWDSALGRANVRVRLRARASALREGHQP